jgi:hypothetical protein
MGEALFKPITMTTENHSMSDGYAKSATTNGISITSQKEKKREPARKQLPLFPAGSRDERASRSPLPGSEEAQTMTATSGRSCYESWKSYARPGLSAKMFLDCFLSATVWKSKICLLRWKLETTNRGYSIIRLRASVPCTEETGFSLLPTLRAYEGGAFLNEEGNYKPSGLQAIARHNLWPTPAASMWKGTGRPGSKSQEWDNATGRLKGDSRLFENGQTGQLNPAWVEALQGFPPGWTEVE